jgi:hypothetical protein
MQDLQNVLITIAIAILPVLSAYIIALLKKKTAEAEQRIGNTDINQYVEIASDAISSAVAAVTQTYVDGLKGTDGWTKEAQQEAFAQAKTKALIIMGEAAQGALNVLYGDADEWIETKIEQAVKWNKAA